MQRATMAVVDRLRPRPTAKTKLRSDSVRPTVATAFAPRRPTQKTSTTAKRDSSTISRTMGMASRRIARLRLPVVKSWCEPRTASRMELHSVGVGAATTVCSSDIEPLRSAWAWPEKSGARTRLRKWNGQSEWGIQIRVSGGLESYSDLGDEHGRCPWRCLCVSTAPDVRIFRRTLLEQDNSTSNRCLVARGIRGQRTHVKEEKAAGQIRVH